MDSVIAAAQGVRPIRVASIATGAGLHRAISKDLACEPRTVHMWSARSLQEGLSKPSLACVDVAMIAQDLPDGSALDFMVRLKQINPKAHVIILADQDDDVAALCALDHGASGWLVRHQKGASFSMAAQIVFTGGCALSWAIARRLVRQPTDGASSQVICTPPKLSKLTGREADVVRHVASGLSSKEIARAMEVSTETVNYHLKSVYRKFNAHTRGQLLRLAVDEGSVVLH